MISYQKMRENRENEREQGDPELGGVGGKGEREKKHQTDKQ